MSPTEQLEEARTEAEIIDALDRGVYRLLHDSGERPAARPPLTPATQAAWMLTLPQTAQPRTDGTDPPEWLWLPAGPGPAVVLPGMPPSPARNWLFAVPLTGDLVQHGILTSEEVHAWWLTLPKLPDGRRPRHPLLRWVKGWHGRLVPDEWDERRYGNLPAPLATTGHVLPHRELSDGQTALPFDYDALTAQRQPPPDEPRFEIGYLPTLAPEPSKLVPCALLDLWDTGAARGRHGPVPLARRIGLEVLLSVPPDARGNDAVLLSTTMGQLLSGTHPGTKYVPSRHGPQLLRALHEVHNGKVAWSADERGALRVLVAVRDWPKSYDYDAPLAFDVRLPPGSRQGPQIDKHAVRMTWYSYRHNRLLLTAYCLFDRYGTVKGRLIAPTLPVVLRDKAGYVLGPDGKIVTEHGKTTRRTTHPRAVQTGEREDNPEALARYPVLTGRDLILAGYPVVDATARLQRKQRDRVIGTARELDKPVTKLPNRGAPDRRRPALLRADVAGTGTARKLRLMPIDEYLAAHAARWAARKHDRR